MLKPRWQSNIFSKISNGLFFLRFNTKKKKSKVFLIDGCNKAEGLIAQHKTFLVEV